VRRVAWGSGNGRRRPRRRRCYLSDVDVEAAILALQHSFIVNNYGNSSKTINYSINQFGATAENFFELFGYFTGNGTLSSGYNAVSTWDNRFGFLGPPAYLKTGTQSTRRTGTSPRPTLSRDLVHQQLDLCAVAADHRPADGDVGLHRHRGLQPVPGRAPAIPSVAGDTYAQAQTALTAAASSRPRATGRRHGPDQRGHRTNPAAGLAAPGSTISVIVSLG